MIGNLVSNALGTLQFCTVQKESTMLSPLLVDESARHLIVQEKHMALSVHVRHAR